MAEFVQFQLAYDDQPVSICVDNVKSVRRGRGHEDPKRRTSMVDMMDGTTIHVWGDLDDVVKKLSRSSRYG